jgi:hypothetical protein
MEKIQIWDPGSGINIRIIFPRTSYQFSELKIFKFFVPDPGSGSFLTLDPVSGINIPDPQH